MTPVFLNQPVTADLIGNSHPEATPLQYQELGLREPVLKGLGAQLGLEIALNLFPKVHRSTDNRRSLT
jgi:hypothetical protein